jgi:hypothetical protein
MEMLPCFQLTIQKTYDDSVFERTCDLGMGGMFGSKMALIASKIYFEGSMYN